MKYILDIVKTETFIKKLRLDVLIFTRKKEENNGCDRTYLPYSGTQTTTLYEVVSYVQDV